MTILSAAIPPLKVPMQSGYLHAFLDNMMAMQKEARFTDFMINVQGSSIPCHKVVLSSGSPYFKALFEANMKEAQEGQIDFKDHISKDVVHNLLQYMYGQDIHVQWHDVQQYIDAIEMLQLPHLKQQMDVYIAQHIDYENSFDMFFLADRYGLDDTRIATAEKLKLFFHKMIESQEFKMLGQDGVESLLSAFRGNDSHLHLPTRTCDVMMKTCVAWVMADLSSRRSLWGYLLSRSVSIDECSQSYRRFLADDLLLNDALLYFTINKGICDESVGSDVAETHETLLIFDGVKDDGVNDWILHVDLLTNTVSKTGTVSVDDLRSNYASCSTPYGLFGGGGIAHYSSSFTDVQQVRRCGIINPETLERTSLPDLLSPAHSSAAVCVDETVFVLGGHGKMDDECFVARDAMQCLNLAEDPEQESWTRCEDMIHEVSSPIAWSVGQEVFVLPMLDFTSSDETMHLQCYDVNSNEWNLRTPPPATVRDTLGACSVVVRDGDHEEVYIVGGEGRLCLRYRSSEDTWEELEQPVLTHAYGGAAYAGGRIMLIGGFEQGLGASDLTSTVEEYNIETDSWKKSSIELPFPMCDVSCITA